jgi:hypothetical protein
MRFTPYFVTALLLVGCAEKEKPSSEPTMTVQVAYAKIIVPFPPNFVEVGPANRQLFPSEAPNHLVAWFVSPDDLKLMGLGSTNLCRRYMQIQRLKGATYDITSARQFAALAKEVLEQYESLRSSDVEFVNRVMSARVLESNDFTKLTVGNPEPLEIFLNIKDAVGYLTLIKLSAKSSQREEEITMVCSTTFMRVKEKVLFAYVYCAADEPDALGWVKSTSKSWIEAILRSN